MMWYQPGEKVLVDGCEATIVEQLCTEPGTPVSFKIKVQGGEYTIADITQIRAFLPAFCKPGCECGVGVLGSGKHSDWCPQARFE